MSSKRVIFLHIRKSGGTTFNNVLSMQYFGCKSYWATPKNPPKEFLKLPQSERDKIKLVRGHINFGSHEWFSNDSTNITVLRNPNERVFSYLNYWKQDAEAHSNNHGWWFELIRKHSPEELLSQQMHPELENGMVRQLSGKGHIREKCSQQDLELAMHNLEKRCVAFGLTELFDESLAVFQKVLGWRLPIVYSSAKVRSKNIIEPNERLYELISEYNVLDQKLYQFAIHLFKEKYQHFNLSTKIERNKHYNRILSPVINLLYLVRK